MSVGAAAAKLAAATAMAKTKRDMRGEAVGLHFLSLWIFMASGTDRKRVRQDSDVKTRREHSSPGSGGHVVHHPVMRRLCKLGIIAVMSHIIVDLGHHLAGVVNYYDSYYVTAIPRACEMSSHCTISSPWNGIRHC